MSYVHKLSMNVDFRESAREHWNISVEEWKETPEEYKQVVTEMFLEYVGNLVSDCIQKKFESNYRKLMLGE